MNKANERRSAPSIPSTPSTPQHSCRGVSILELLITIGIIGLLASISGQLYVTALERARITKAIADVRVMESMLQSRETQGALPETLGELGWKHRDPWGNDYRYLNFMTADPESLAQQDGKPKGARRDKFLKPLNSTYDLYSVGRDGMTKPSLNHQHSRDDIVRAADSSYVGLASGF